MSWFEQVQTPLPGLHVLQGRAFSDRRGEFSRLYCAQELSDLVGVASFPQANRSVTHEVGAIRGMHFQNPPFCEVKLVRCLQGRVWDVAVDLRAGSPTFLRSHAEQLSGDNHRVMVIPEGFAHGFQVLEPGSELVYFHSRVYRPEAESGLRYDDPCLAIDWPLPVAVMSERDLSFDLLTDSFTGLRL